jgi:putative membrane protein
MLSGALLGFVLPVASALAHSVNLADFAVWGVVALVVQLIVYLALRLSFRPLHELIEQDRLSVAILCAAIGVGAGVLNAAAMTY